MKARQYRTAPRPTARRYSPARPLRTIPSRALRTRRAKASTLVERTTPTINWIKLIAETGSALLALIVAVAALFGYTIGG